MPHSESYMLPTSQVGYVAMVKDCKSKQAAYLNRLNLNQEGARYHSAKVGFPDMPYTIKSIRLSLYWWWLYKDESLFFVRSLLVIKEDLRSDAGLSMRAALSLGPLRNKDRMSVGTVVEMVSTEVQEAIPEEPLLVTLIPKPYFKWTKNSSGDLSCPVEVCFYPSSSSIFVLDREKVGLLLVTTHSPPDVTRLAGNGAGTKDGPGKVAQIMGPCSLDLLDGFLFISDPPAGSIRIADVRKIDGLKVEGKADMEDASEEEGVDEEVREDEGRPVGRGRKRQPKTYVSTLRLQALEHGKDGGRASGTV
jgi:hypothetical protein